MSVCSCVCLHIHAARTYATFPLTTEEEKNEIKVNNKGVMLGFGSWPQVVFYESDSGR